MRLLASLLLVVSVAGADELIVVSRAQYVGLGVGVAPAARGAEYVPVLLTQREAGRGHVRILDPDLRPLMESALSGTSSGMTRHGRGIVLAMHQRSGLVLLEISLREGGAFGFDGRLHDSTEYRPIPLDALQEPRLLRLGSVGERPLAVVAHKGGLLVSSADRRSSRDSLLARPGREYVAATEPFEADRRGLADVFVVSRDTLLHLAVSGTRTEVVGEVGYDAQGFVPQAIEGGEGVLWLGGSRDGRAMIHRLDLRRRPREGTWQPSARLDLGAGAVRHVRVLDRDRLVVAGVRDRRSWVAVVSAGRRAFVEHESILPGGGVVALAVNPARRGWSIAAATDDRKFHLLRIPGDAEAEAGADTPPEEIPEPEQPVEPGPPAAGPPGAEPGASMVVFPRVRADLQTDTELIFVNVGSAPMRLTLHLRKDDGSVAARRSLLLERGRRVRVALTDLVAAARLAAFDGYLVAEGGRRRDLVVEAILRHGREPPEQLRPHWR